MGLDRKAVLTPESQPQKEGRLIGYARVSTGDQNTALQLDALQAVGCAKVFEDTASGATTKRPGLDAALAALQHGDTLVVWRLDRLGRSLAHLVSLVADLEGRGVGFKSLNDAIDTTTPSGRLVFGIMGSLAQFERDLTRERTKAGQQAAKRRGTHIGRRKALNSDQLAHARLLIGQGQPVSLVARTLGVGESTLYRALALN